MTVTEEEIPIQEAEDTKTPKGESKTYDIVEVLEATNHLTHVSPNGLVLGVRMSGISGTRGVHVEIVHVLDLRKAIFGKGGFAMQASVLESVNRELPNLLRDVGLRERLEEPSPLTPWGRVPMHTLRSASGKRKSLVYETRLVYVVTQDVRSSADLSWLTANGRVVSVHDFSLARKSDARTILPDLEKNLVADKWNSFSRAVRNGWYGVLAAGASVLGGVTSLMVLLSNSGNLIAPLAFMGVCGAGAAWLLRQSHNGLNEFRKVIESEQAGVASLGDRKRVADSIKSNEKKIGLIGDLSFVISPLMASASKKLEDGDINGAVVLAEKVLDELVRLSPSDEGKKGIVTGDAGIEKFIGVFRNVGANLTEAEEVSLALAYTAVTGHVTTPLGVEEALTHMAVLNTSLFNAGVLSPTVRGSIDDMFISRACQVIVDEFGEDLAKPEEVIVQTVEEDGSGMEELLGDIAKSGPVAEEHEGTANPKVEETPENESPEGEPADVESTGDEAEAGRVEAVEVEIAPLSKAEPDGNQDDTDSNEELEEEPISEVPDDVNVAEVEGPEVSVVVQSSLDVVEEEKDPSTGPETLRRKKKQAKQRAMGRKNRESGKVAA
ncbi:MAG: hypothetical protein KAU89_02075 [Candidatus Thorarchaeota archaeon]|jgi:hypothetical protein|nr:hypothetical protein [Candidatus Thorarchaeota archaeon]